MIKTRKNFRVSLIPVSVALLLISVFSLAFDIQSVKSEAQTIIVPDGYQTIQAAVDAAFEGDTIFVRNGSYGVVVVNKAVKLVAESRDSIIADNTNDYTMSSLKIIADDVTVMGFTVSGGGNHAAIRASNVKGINVSQNYLEGNPSLALTSVSNSTFSRNHIPPQGEPWGPWGISMEFSPFSTFLWNNISSCSIVSSSNNNFSGNYIIGDGYHHMSWWLDISNSSNIWNFTYPSVGNYWGSHYTGVDLKKGLNQDKPGGDGIGDTPYIINDGNIDNYPLMRPSESYFTRGIPFAYFNYSSPNGLAGENVTFDASSSFDLNGHIVSYAWDFGDGVTATGPLVTHAYGNVYNNPVKLTVTDNNGLTDTSKQLVRVGMVPTSISISTSASSMFAGFKVDISGTLRDVYGYGLIGKTIVLSYTFSGIYESNPITSCTTDNYGNYLATWIPTATGSFALEASWSGTDTVSPTSSTTTLNCLSYDQYVFSVESNSSISDLAFNTTAQTLSFTATGGDGTSGYVRASVAKNFTANPASVKVLVDGNQVTCSPTSTSDTCLVYFTYQHSAHKIIIDLSVASQPTPTPTPASSGSLPSEVIYAIAAVAIAAIAAAVVIVYIRKRKFSC